MKVFPHFAVSWPRAGFGWHQEDAWAASSRGPIYAVADGVTLPLDFYPDDGAKRVAEAFCQGAIEFLNQEISPGKEENLKVAVKPGQKFARQYNDARDLEVKYSTVAAWAVVEDQVIKAARLTDCGLALFRQGKQIQKTPEFWTEAKKSQRQGYGVINGEGDPTNQIDFYSWPYQAGDFLCLYTDGFENHFNAPEFTEIFAGELSSVKKNLKLADDKLNRLDGALYGDERTLLVAHLK